MTRRSATGSRRRGDLLREGVLAFLLRIAEMKAIDGDIEFVYGANGNPVARFVKTQIPGLWTPNVERKKMFLESVNIILVKLKIPQFEDVNLEQGCYVLLGVTSVSEFAGMVRKKLELDAELVLTFACNGKEIAGGSILSDVYKEHISGDGFLDILCTIGFA